MHRYYNPELDDAGRSILDWENWVVLTSTQAAAGAITRNMVAVVVHPGAIDRDMSVEFVTFTNPWAADKQAMADLADDLDVYLGGHIQIRTVVTVDREWRPKSNSRLIYLARHDPPATVEDEVVVGTAGGRSVRFRNRIAPTGPDPYDGSHFVVDVLASGISVTQSVFMFGFDWTALMAYFQDLSDSWRGWQGVKEWTSGERDLTIRAESDSVGHCFFTFEVRPGADCSWHSSVGGFVVNLGEDMAALSSTVRDWVES